MIKTQDVVRDIIYADEEALYALSKGYMNYSAYAKIIQSQVEDTAKKEVKVSGIVVALSRIKQDVKDINPLVQDVKITNIVTKSPLTEISFEKTPAVLEKLSSLYKKVRTTQEDFLTMTLSTTEVNVICSDRIRDQVLKHFVVKPRLLSGKLASIGISFDPKYYNMPNVTFSLTRRIAQKRILLAETITTHTEIIFTFHQKDLPQMLSLFQM